MEEAKLLAYHAQLKSGAPAGGRGGLGVGKHHKVVREDATLPKNALYSRFVRAGTWDPADDLIGSQFTGKRQKFEEEADGSGAGAEAASDVVATITLHAGGKVDVSVAPGGSGKESSGSGVGSKRKRPEAAASADSLTPAHVQGLLKVEVLSLLRAAAEAGGADASVSRSKIARRAVSAVRDGVGEEALAEAGFGKDDLKGVCARALTALLLRGSVESNEDGDELRLGHHAAAAAEPSEPEDGSSSPSSETSSSSEDEDEAARRKAAKKAAKRAKKEKAEKKAAKKAKKESKSKAEKHGKGSK